MNYETMKRITLASIAKTRGIKNITNMSKIQLVNILKKNDNDPSCISDENLKKELYQYKVEWYTKNKDHWNNYQREYQREYINKNKRKKIRSIE